MRYLVKKPGTWIWNPLVTDSVATELANGRIGSDWRIRQEGQAEEFTVEALLQASGEQKRLGVYPSATTQCYVYTGEQRTGPYLPEQIKSMWRSGAITADATLGWDGHGERVPIPMLLKNPFFGRSATTDSIGSKANSSSPHPLPLVAAGAMLVGFFLPWAQLFGFGASGYNLGQLGSYGNLAWIIPIVAVLVIVLNLAIPEARPLQVIAGLIPWTAFLYGLANAGPNLLQVLSIGPYVILIAGVVLIFCPSQIKSTT